MSAVLATPPFLAFYDNDGNPLSGGLIYTYAAGTTTPKATFTDESGLTPNTNPIVLDASGRATWWLIGSYKYVVKDALGTTIATTDNVTSFTTLAAANDAYFQSFSGTGVQTAFTASQDLGTDEKGLMVFVDSGTPTVVDNGTFVADTDWTKGAGWTIGSGVATATGAISTAISQDANTSLIEGRAYNITYTITRTAGGLIPSVGGQDGTEQTAAGTYRETIIAGSTQALAFTGNGFTGTLDNITISLANSKGYEILPPSAFTISGTSLSFATAPAVGSGNIYVFAPSLLLGAASAAAAAAEASATQALTSETNAAVSASSAAAYAAAKNEWTFSTNVNMADPSTGNLRVNNSTISLAASIAISDLSANSGNPDLGTWIDTWDAGSGSNRGSIYIFVDNANFAIFNVNGDITDNTSWHQVPVTYVAGAGTIADADPILIGFTAAGQTTVTGGITALTGDVTASGSGSVVATIAAGAVGATELANTAVSAGSYTAADITVDAQGRITAAASGSAGLSVEDEDLTTSGYVELSNGLTLQWGQDTGDNATTTFPVAFTALYSVTVTPRTRFSWWFVTSQSTTGFAVDFNDGSQNFNWIAIGIIT